MGRTSILKSIKRNKPELVTLPKIDLDLFSEKVDLIETFKSNVQLVGGSLKELNKNEDLDMVIKELYPEVQKIVSQKSGSNLGSIAIEKESAAHSLENIDLAIIKGEFGVAENGAVWISENDFPVRVLPFITNDLVVVLPKQVLIQDQAPVYGNPEFTHAGGKEIIDYTPKNIQLIKNKGIVITKIPNDKNGLFTGLNISKDILGNPIKGLPDMGAIELE